MSSPRKLGRFAGLVSSLLLVSVLLGLPVSGAGKWRVDNFVW